MARRNSPRRNASLIPEVLSEIGKLRLSAPLKIGDVAKENVAGSGVNLVVTEDIK